MFREAPLSSDTSPLPLVIVDKMITSGELINSRSVKCLLSSCYVLETVLDHHRQSSCSEGFSHGSRGLAQWGGPLGFRQEELYHAF